MLARVVTTIPEAARQLRIPSATLRYWLEGGDREGRRYDPVLRPDRTGAQTVTWGEMVEARYLRAYRSHVPMQRLRPFIDALRAEFAVPYPLAHFRPYIDASRHLVLRLPPDAGAADDLWLLFEGADGQERLNHSVAQGFPDRVQLEDSSDG